MFLGIDLGTSSLKIILMDEEQNILVSVKKNLEIQREKPKYCEQSPKDWINALDYLMDDLKQNHEDKIKNLKAIGLSGQMHGAVVLDKNGEVLRPCILWNDTRSFNEAKFLDEIDDFREISGNIVFPGFTAPKLLWIKNNEPEIFQKIKMVLLPKDYIRYYLTGEYISDMSDSSGTSWLDVKNRVWSKKLLSHTYMSVEQMPRLVESIDKAGVVKEDFTLKWKLPKEVILSGGAGDNVATSIALGVTNNSDAFVSLGTSGVLFSPIDKYMPNASSAVHTFCHASTNKWHHMGVILSATNCLDWFSHICGSSSNDLIKKLGDTLNPPTSLVFLPYLSGERTPHNDVDIQGSFVGLNHKTKTEDMTQAILEGVSFALKDNLHVLKEAGNKINRISILGGGSNSKYWLELLSTILDMPIDVFTKGDYGAAFGAARLGLITYGNKNIVEICKTLEISNTIYPNLEIKDKFDKNYQKFKKLYLNISSI